MRIFCPLFKDVTSYNPETIKLGIRFDLSFLQKQTTIIMMTSKFKIATLSIALSVAQIAFLVAIV